MVVSTTLAHASLLQGLPPEDLRLRIMGTQRAGEIVRLSAAKCTVGSAAGCTLRLRAAGVRAVHCVIYRGTLGTVVRACGAPARINGQRLSDATLNPGDRLQVGPIELEVLADEDNRRWLLDDAGLTETLVRKEDAPSYRQHRVHKEQARLNRQRARKLIEDLRELRTRPARQEEAGAAPAEAQSAEAQVADTREIEEAASQLARGREELQWRQEQWEATRQAQQMEQDDHKRRLAVETAQLETLRAELAEQQSKWQRQVADEQKALAAEQDRNWRAEEEHRKTAATLADERQAWAVETANQREEFAREHDELARQREAFARERAEVAEQQEQLNRQVAELQLQSAQTQAELDAQLARLDSQQQAWTESQRDAAQRELQERTSAFEAECTVIRGQFEHQRQAADEAAGQLDGQRQQLVQRQTELEQARAQFERQQAEAGQAQAELARQRAEFDQQRAELERADAEQRLQQDEQAQSLAAKEQQLAQQVAQQLAAERAGLDQVAAQAESQRAEQIQSLAAQRALLAQQQHELEQAIERHERERTEQSEALVKEQQELAERRRELLTEVQTRSAEFEQKVHALNVRGEELKALERSIEEHQTRSQEQAHITHERLHQLEEIHRQQRELDEVRGELARQQEALSAQRRDSAEQCDAALAEVEKLRAELQGERARFEARRDAWEAERLAAEHAVSQPVQTRPDEEDEEEAAPAAPLAPSWRQSVLAQPASIEDEEDDEPAVANTARQTARAAAADPAAPVRSSDDEESIEDYMAALLNRMRGGADVAPVIAPAPKRNKRKSDAAPAAEEPTAPVERPEMRVEQVLDMPTAPAELTRRTQQVPISDLSAMRELANTQARSAIDTHGRKRLLQSIVAAGGAAVACFAVTLIVYAVTPAELQVLRSASLLGVVGGCYWLFQAGLRTRRFVTTYASGAKAEIRALLAKSADSASATGNATTSVSAEPAAKTDA